MLQQQRQWHNNNIINYDNEIDMRIINCVALKCPNGDKSHGMCYLFHVHRALESFNNSMHNDASDNNHAFFLQLHAVCCIIVLHN